MKIAMPAVQVDHKSVDVFFEVLDIGSRRKLLFDLKHGETIKLPALKNQSEKILTWKDLDVVDRQKLELLSKLNAPKPTYKYNHQTKEYEKIALTGQSFKKAHSIIAAFYKLAGYDRGLIKPGYRGKFIIGHHFAEKAGEHFDLRLEFPVTSLETALGTYGHKRIPGATIEPLRDKYPDKPGTVYRSFAVKKHILPTADKKLFIVETEDHPINYEFEGTIESGYGAGRVKNFDKGTYELVDVDGDKKYIINFKGKKLKGLFSLIKYKQGYLWVKNREND